MTFQRPDLPRVSTSNVELPSDPTVVKVVTVAPSGGGAIEDGP